MTDHDPTEAIKTIRGNIEKAIMQLTAYGENNTNWLRNTITMLNTLETYMRSATLDELTAETERLGLYDHQSIPTPPQGMRMEGDDGEAYMNRMGVEPSSHGIIMWILKELNDQPNSEFEHKYLRRLINSLVEIEVSKALNTLETSIGGRTLAASEVTPEWYVEIVNVGGDLYHPRLHIDNQAFAYSYIGSHEEVQAHKRMMEKAIRKLTASKSTPTSPPLGMQSAEDWEKEYERDEDLEIYGNDFKNFIRAIQNDAIKNAVPAGYVLVPIEPTQDMINKMVGRVILQSKNLVIDGYKAMLAAAPTLK